MLNMAEALMRENGVAEKVSECLWEEYMKVTDEGKPTKEMVEDQPEGVENNTPMQGIPNKESPQEKGIHEVYESLKRKVLKADKRWGEGEVTLDDFLAYKVCGRFKKERVEEREMLHVLQATVWEVVWGLHGESL